MTETTEQTINNFIAFSKEVAKRIVEGDGEEHDPILFFLKDGTHAFAPVLDGMHPAHVLEIILKKMNPDAYVIITEAWAWASLVEESDPRTDKILNGDLHVSDLPLAERKEILVISSCVKGQRARMSIADIVTVANARMVQPWRDIDDSKDGEGVSGRLAVKEW